MVGLALPPPLFGGLGLGVGALLLVFCGVFSASLRPFSPSFFRPSRASWCCLGFRVSLLSFLVPSRALPSPFPRVFVFALFQPPAFPRLFSAFSSFFSLFFSSFSRVLLFSPSLPFSVPPSFFLVLNLALPFRLSFGLAFLSLFSFPSFFFPALLCLCFSFLHKTYFCRFCFVGVFGLRSLV